MPKNGRKKPAAPAKEKLGRGIPRERAQAYPDGREPLPDEAAELINGGGCGEYDP
ncbi:MAG: hypothetical protein PHI27_04225 [Eubacteriales bacterium]|nr:hypothetical protein [Eubacteriales bacterium]